MRTQEEMRQALLRAAWRDRFAEHVFEIMPTASADPELIWAANNGGPVCPTYQWHRTAFYDDPDLDA